MMQMLSATSKWQSWDLHTFILAPRIKLLTTTQERKKEKKERVPKMGERGFLIWILFKNNFLGWRKGRRLMRRGIYV